MKLEITEKNIDDVTYFSEVDDTTCNSKTTDAKILVC